MNSTPFTSTSSPTPASPKPASPRKTRLRTPPTFGPLQIARSLPTLMRDPLNVLLEARNTYGDVYTLDLGFTKAIAVNHPQHAQHVFRDNGSNYYKDGPVWRELRTLFGNGLTVSNGDYWLRQRRMIQPQFHRERLAILVDLMMDVICEDMESWDAIAASNEPFNVQAAFTTITMRVILKTMFGPDLDPGVMDYLAKEISYVLDSMLWGGIIRSARDWAHVPGQGRYQEALQNIDREMYKLIERCRHTGGDCRAFMGMLLDMVDGETEERMTNKQLRDEVVTMFLAGYETTSATLAWTTHMLTQHPEHMRLAQAEVDAVIGEREPVLADVPKLSYARLIFQETLRLYAPPYWLPRVAHKDDEIDGWAIPAGTVVAPMLYVIHRHPEFWPEPERFDPTRFLPERAAGRHSLAWMAFGAGQRQCIGKEFAMMEGQLILARVLQRYTMTAVPERLPKATVHILRRATGGIWVRLAKRQRGQN